MFKIRGIQNTSYLSLVLNGSDINQNKCEEKKTQTERKENVCIKDLFKI